MTVQELLPQLTDGTTLEGPHWAEPVRVLTAKTRGPRVEVQAVGLNTRRLWTKLLNPDEFGGQIKGTLFFGEFPVSSRQRLERAPIVIVFRASAHLGSQLMI
jgi:hypothetical protein